MNQRPLWGSVVLYAFAALVVIVSVYPFLYTVTTSLKTGTALFSTSLLPDAPTLSNYVALFNGKQPFGTQLGNSIMVATVTVTISMLMAITGAYALGRIDFKGKSTLLLAILAVSMFPQVAVLSGMFELMQALGLYNRSIGLVLPYTVFTLPFTVWMLTTFMRGLPKELEEAAIMDGCGPLRIIFEVFMPLLAPALVSTGLLAFIGAWNEFLFALTFMTDDFQRTVPVGISMISGATAYEIPWGSIMAASVIVTVPLVLLVLVFQKKIVSGLTAGAVKG
ncbi:carbohydrate ABC transporter permease [Sphaerotilus montanus]|jgi:trehalose/maltose transport system permease protein|uniref:Trehalose/maltose transport system permease protein n=1 Tax=Sphaerotilus montanus TaxID=522889 RepID=A0A7Y9R146_9BURK|nr:carbohydrate ABC transporter permease [Sphaerotilus montanus]NYG33684.1 trehalose/maltose transport system permease protein [Sphaerotilus montanus]NZD56598.1 carbohydrate ABC transporter permease [Sphaerotilus montanus]